MILSLGGIALVVAVLLAVVHQLTAEPISAGALKAKTEALNEVLPPFDNNPFEGAVATTTPDGTPATLMTATRGGHTVGYAVECSTFEGFSGEIRLLIGFDTAGAVTGYAVLEHAETPGLGAKMGEWFRDPAADRSIIGSTDPLAVKADGGRVDAITAATITSRAFLGAVNSARSLLPVETPGKPTDAITSATHKVKK